MKLTRVTSLFVATVFLCSAVAFAKPDVKLTLSESLVTQVDGKTTLSDVPSDGAKRGSILRLTILARNAGDESALQFEPVGSITAGEEFVGGSASRNAPVQYSLDKKTWSAQPTVDVKLPNGKTVKKAADPSAYVAVRWIVAKIAPKKSLSFTYEVRVK